MPFDSFSSLQTSLLSWLGRPGDPNVPTEDIIALFEADASTRLRTHFQETSTNLYTVGEIDTYDLPDDFEEIREVSITSLDPIVVLDYQTPSQLDDTWIDTDPDQPYNYTLEGTSIRFAPVPDGQYTIRVEYFQAIVPLSDTSYAATSLAIASPGHAYAVGDQLIVSGGVPSPDAESVTVITVDSVSTANTYAAASFTIAAAGQNFLAGDILSLSGGTSTQVTEITVDTVQAAITYTASLEDINNGGTGYTVGDVLSVIGGTVVSGQAVRITVDAVNGSGTITAAHITQAGVYTAYPTNPAGTSGGTGNGTAFVDLTWTQLTPQGAILTAHVSNAGTYTVTPSNPVSAINGAGSGATFTMTWALDTQAGEITAASITEAGDYATAPSNPVSVTGGSGSGNPTFNLDYTQSGGDTNWLLQKYPQLYLYGSLAEAELFLGADNSNDRFQLFVARRDDLYNKITLQDRKYRYGGASLQIKTDTGNP
jgi:hypothetical protein